MYLALNLGDLIVMFARGVGVLVAIVAALVCFLLTMILRALLAFMLLKWGVSGVMLFVGLSVYGIMIYAKMPSKVIWVMLLKSCS